MKNKNTGLFDSDGKEIKSGDKVSLDGNITADDSFGHLPNGFTFGEDDIYEVFFDEKIKHWSLKLRVKPDTDINKKYYNHALSLLHDRCVKIVNL